MRETEGRWLHRTGLLLGVPGMARDLEVQVLCGPWSREPLAERQLRRRDASWEGNCRQTCGPMNKNRIGGGVARARGPGDPKPDVTRNAAT
jgi:hypothetical protein